MSFHAKLKEDFRACVVKRCRRGNCHLDLEGSKHPVTTLDCDAEPLSVAGPRCDFLIFLCEPPETVVAVEMKGQTWEPKDVRNQLEGGAALAAKLAGSNRVSYFVALLLHQGVRHASQLKALSAYRVRFQGRNFPILQRRCGVSLKAAVAC
jgi:hypothetical protein